MCLASRNSFGPLSVRCCSSYRGGFDAVGCLDTFCGSETRLDVSWEETTCARDIALLLSQTKLTPASRLSRARCACEPSYSLQAVENGHAIETAFSLLPESLISYTMNSGEGTVRLGPTHFVFQLLDLLLQWGVGCVLHLASCKLFNAVSHGGQDLCAPLIRIHPV